MNPEVASLLAENRRLKTEHGRQVEEIQSLQAEIAQLREIADPEAFQHVLEATVDLFNYAAEIARDSGIIRARACQANHTGHGGRQSRQIT